MKPKPFPINLHLPNHAKHIIVFHNGKVVEEGMQNELIQHGREYEKRYELQFCENTKSCLPQQIARIIPF